MTALKTYAFPNSILFGSQSWPFQGEVTGQTPAYNITKTNDDTFTVTLSVPGVSESDVEVTEHEGRLNVSFTADAKANTDSQDQETPEVTYIRRGITAQYEDLSFKLGAHMRVVEAKLDKGLLSIQLHRDIPEALQPKRIEVSQAA